MSRLQNSGINESTSAHQIATAEEQKIESSQSTSGVKTTAKKVKNSKKSKAVQLIDLSQPANEHSSIILKKQNISMFSSGKGPMNTSSQQADLTDDTPSKVFKVKEKKLRHVVRENTNNS